MISKVNRAKKFSFIDFVPGIEPLQYKLYFQFYQFEKWLYSCQLTTAYMH